MDAANCTFTVPSDLDSLEQLPTESLLRLVRECDNICEIVVGFGNPDLFGVGVLISHIIQYVLAVLYGPYLFISLHVFPSRRISSPRYCLNAWLSTQQAVALWSQLFYTLAIVLACVVRRHQNTLQAYEGAMILYIIFLCITSAHLTWVAFLHRIRRWIVFITVVGSIAALGLYGESSPALEQKRHWNVIQACLEKFAIDIPFDLRIPLLAGASVLMLLMGLAWFYLYRKVPGHGRISLIRPPGRALTRICIWAATGCIVFGMVILPTLQGLAIYYMFLFRNSLVQTLPRIGKQWQENVWGLGQVIACFSWAPLLLETGYAVINTIIGKCPKEQTREYNSDIRLNMSGIIAQYDL